ncbi:hypothetical protein Nepgr_005784 [Nepenthes gracilis]|uniref:Uncharacterized protein n=1 Tax=Nepenthes gracilis TaxID=150966 RepID=A0AAD3XGS4_NEPGR|nr:hypothetical protein Nepgr_005784 [Nepenthes gracilis]
MKFPLNGTENESRKRKRAEAGERGGVEMNQEQNREIHSETDKLPPRPRPPPSEKKVEEFYAILRRIHPAVKYFEMKGNGDGRNGWMALEADLPELNGVGCKSEREKKVSEVVTANGVSSVVSFDLNAVPEAESNSD